MKYNSFIEKTDKISNGLIFVVGLAAFFFLLIPFSEALFYLEREFYYPYKLWLNVIFYLSPIIALLLYNVDDKETFYLGRGILYIYTILLDCIYISILMGSYDSESETSSLGVVAHWLYIIPAILVTFINYHLIKMAKIYKYCPKCGAKLSLREQLHCHNCGFFLRDKTT